jgi:hypothetical protein
MHQATLIPADGLSYGEAFERFFDARPDAAALRAEIDRVSVVRDEAELQADRSDHDEAWLRWDLARRGAHQSFRDALVSGALTAYQRDPRTGERLRVLESYWLTPAGAPELTNEPSVFFLKSDFGGMPLNAKGSPNLDRAMRALKALFGSEIPSQSIIGNKSLCKQVLDWCAEQGLEPISSSTILRAARRKN